MYLLDKCKQFEDKELEFRRVIASHELLSKGKEHMDNDLNG